MRTIKLKGKDYVPVSARVEQFHQDYPDGVITTSYKFKEGYVVFKAQVEFGFTDTKTNRTFTGHAFGEIGVEKAFEKLETTAVGRALAFAGYLAGGEIASADEMEKFADSSGNSEVDDILN